MNKHTRLIKMTFLWPAVSMILAILLIIVSYQNLQFKKELDRKTISQQLSSEYPTLQTGDRAPALEAYQADGHLINLVTDSLTTPIILAWYSDECDVCYFSKESWNTLANEFPGRIWALKKAYDYEPNSLFFGDSVNFPLLFPVDPEIYEQYKIDITPQTMIIDKYGIVKKVWVGVLNPAKVTEVINQM